MPRKIIVDNLSEWYDYSDAECYDVAETVDAIRYLARERSRWCVTIQLDQDNLEEFVSWMIPIPNISQSPILLMGGAALFVDEADYVAPPRAMSEEVRTLYRRSRHVGLTVISATQRPANVSREVSAMSTQAVMLALSEPRDIRFMAETLGLTPAELQQWARWVQKHRHGGLWWHRQSNRLCLMDDSGAMHPVHRSQRLAFANVAEPDREPTPKPVQE